MKEMNAKNLKVLTDNELVTQAQYGNQYAMGELYTRYYMLVFNKCLSFAKNTEDASDLAQDIMIKVIEKINSFKGDAKFSTWLYAVTFNYCTDSIRKRRKTSVESVDTLYHLVDNSALETEKAIEKEIRSDMADKAMKTIPLEDQQLLLMKYQSDKSIQEMQLVYNLSASAVKMRLLRARTKVVSVYVAYKSSAA